MKNPVITITNFITEDFLIIINDFTIATRSTHKRGITIISCQYLEIKFSIWNENKNFLQLLDDLFEDVRKKKTPTLPKKAVKTYEEFETQSLNSN